MRGSALSSPMGVPLGYFRFMIPKNKNRLPTIPCEKSVCGLLIILDVVYHITDSLDAVNRIIRHSHFKFLGNCLHQ